MLRILAAGLFASLVVSSANAQTIIKNLDSTTIFKSMQCEIGLFAAKAKNDGLDPALKAHIKYSTNGSYEAKASVQAGVGGILKGLLTAPSLSASYDFTKVDANTLEGKLNVNQGNTATCVNRKPAVPIGIYNFLIDNEAALKGGFTATKKTTVTAKANFDASGKFTFWVITLGPDISFGIVISYEIDLDAPAADTATGAPKPDKKVSMN